MTATVTERARAWQHARQEELCDEVRPWAHGTVLRASRFADYWDHNVVRVERDPGDLDVDALVAFADRALDGLAHRRVDVDDVALADALRPDFEARGWQAVRLVLMRHEDPAAPAARQDVAAVEDVPYAAVEELYRAWHREDFPGVDQGGFFDQQRAAAATRDLRVLAVVDAGRPVAFAELRRAEGSAEIASVYVSAPRRGHGLGTALTRAAIAAAGSVDDLWISADDEDRPKLLYQRLGFRPAWRWMIFTRLP